MSLKLNHRRRIRHLDLSIQLGKQRGHPLLQFLYLRLGIQGIDDLRLVGCHEGIHHFQGVSVRLPLVVLTNNRHAHVICLRFHGAVAHISFTHSGIQLILELLLEGLLEGPFSDECLFCTPLDERPGFCKMREQIEHYDLIVCWSVSSLGSICPDVLNAIKWFRERNVGFYFEVEDLYSLDDSFELFLQACTKLKEKEKDLEELNLEGLDVSDFGEYDDNWEQL